MDHGDVSRVTRARSRGMSTDAHNLKPLLDATTKRASPRPPGTTRLNSAISEHRTPVRSTRLSVARGETPELDTVIPSLLRKRASRTPAKSVQKQLTLKENANEELPAGQVEMKVLQELKETDDVETTSNCSVAAAIDEKPDRSASVGPRTRSMLRTPPIGDRTSNNRMAPQSNIKNTHKEKKPTESLPTIQLNFSTTEFMKSLVKDIDIIQSKPESPSPITQKSQHNDKEYQSTVASDELKLSTEQLKTTSKRIEKSQSNDNELDQYIVASNETNKIDKVGSMEQHEEPSLYALKMEINKNDEIYEGDVSKVSSAPFKLNSNDDEPPLIIKADDPKSAVEQLNIFPVPCCNVNKNSPLKTMPRMEFEKAVVINDTDGVSKKTYRKSPFRVNTPQVDLYSLNSDATADIDVCISSITTPATSGSGQPPAQIDTIKPVAELEVKTAEVKIDKKMIARRLLSEDEEEDENEFDQAHCEFIENEAVAVENYQSGDSMDGSERREIEENAIYDAGESLNSQDTTEEHSEDSDDEKLSCIVSDNDEIEKLIYSSDQMSSISDVKGRKKRKRIINHDTTDDDDDYIKQDEDNKKQIINTTVLKEDIDSELEGVFSSSDEKQQKPTVKYTKSVLEVSDSDEKPTKKSEEIGQDLKNKKQAYKRSISKPSDDRNIESVSTGRFVIRNELYLSSDISSKNYASVHHAKNTKSIPVPLNSSSTFKDQDKCENTVLWTEPSNAGEKMDSLRELFVKENRTSTSLLLHSKQMREEKMPGQTVFVQDCEISMHESKTNLKRRSETVAEQSKALSKHKRMSKSVSGAPDDLDANDIAAVQLNKAKQASDSPSDNDSDMSNPAINVKSSVVASKAAAPPNIQSNQPKSQELSVEYCDAIIQTVNELDQKKVSIDAGMHSKKQRYATVSTQTAVAGGDDAPGAAGRSHGEPEKLKKNLKRSKAKKQAMKHTEHVLQTETVSRSLSRKLASDEIASNGNSNQIPKSKIKQVKGPGAENQHVANKLFKNSAGFVTTSDDEDQVKVKTFRIRSGICKVEPCTPKPNPKYFRQGPTAPQELNDLQEPATSSTISKCNKPAKTKERVREPRNWATESALRFKKQIFGRRNE